jgi:alpha-ribazole phosphatase
LQVSRATELILIRHAPALTGGRLCGRTDVEADLSDVAALAALAGAVGPADRVVISPARRCRTTASALWPGKALTVEAALWEQDFGAWEGMPVAELPDLGPLSRADLAAHCAPDGESFTDLLARVAPTLLAMPAGRTAIVAHAGTIRAALALALSDPADALAFEIAPLSLTRVSRHGGLWSIGAVNRVAGWA